MGLRRWAINATAEAEESNATAEATDYTHNEDLLSARQFQALQSWNFLSTIAATSKMVVGMESSARPFFQFWVSQIKNFQAVCNLTTSIDSILYRSKLPTIGWTPSLLANAWSFVAYLSTVNSRHNQGLKLLLGPYLQSWHLADYVKRSPWRVMAPVTKHDSKGSWSSLINVNVSLCLSGDTDHGQALLIMTKSLWSCYG